MTFQFETVQPKKPTSKENCALQNIDPEFLQAIEQLNDGHVNKQEKEKLIAEVFYTLKDTLLQTGAQYIEDVNEIYKKFRNDTLIVRKDDPERLLKALAQKENIVIQRNDSGEYENCALWNTHTNAQALRLAMTEGRGGRELTITFGFEKTPQLHVKKKTMDNVTPDYSTIDRSSARIVDGCIHPEDIRFVVLRMPVSYFPESEMNDKEIEDLEEYQDSLAEHPHQIPQPRYVFRGFTFPSKNEKRV